MNQNGFDLSGVGKKNYGLLKRLDRQLLSEGINSRSYLKVMIPTILAWQQQKMRQGYVSPAMLLKQATIEWYKDKILTAQQKSDSIQQRFTPQTEEEATISYYAHCEYLYARRYIAMRIREGLTKEESHEVGMFNLVFDIPGYGVLSWETQRNTSCNPDYVRQASEEIVQQLEGMYHNRFEVDPFAEYPYETIVEALRK
jgi:hypothetical protein